MVSRENKIVIVCVVLALIVTYGGYFLTELPFEVLFGALMLIGVIVPMTINNYLDNKSKS